MKTALITGIGGQDGAHLAASLLADGVRVVGTTRGAPDERLARLDAFCLSDHVELIQAQPAGIEDIDRLLQAVAPDEIYNLAAQSSVAAFNQAPISGFHANAMAPLLWLEALRLANGSSRFFQASSGEVFGPHTGRIDIKTPMRPANLYGASKALAQQACHIYAQSFGVFASCGVLFAHESPLRDPSFVTRKITSSLARVQMGQQDNLALGNINATRDLGAATDYVEGMRLCLAAETPGNYVFATGAAHSVRDFVEATVRALGMSLEWRGEGVDETGVDPKSGKILVRIDPAFYRPDDPATLVGDPARAERELGWCRRRSFSDIVGEMAEADARIARGNRLSTLPPSSRHGDTSGEKIQ